MTLQSFTLTADGTAVLRLDTVQAYGTAVLISIPTTRPYAGMAGNSYRRSGLLSPRWPRKGSFSPLLVPLATDGEIRSGRIDADRLRERVCLGPGTVRIREGEKLAYYRVQDETGNWKVGEIWVDRLR